MPFILQEMLIWINVQTEHMEYKPFQRMVSRKRPNLKMFFAEKLRLREHLRSFGEIFDHQQVLKGKT